MGTVILFIRHGQYSRGPEKLTRLGKTQSRLTAKLLKQLKADYLLSSTMPRAKETARLIGNEIDLTVSSKSFFREASLPVRAVDFKKIHSEKMIIPERRRLARQTEKYALRADRAYRALLDNPRLRNKTTIVVSHGNVIRYWVCRALGIDPRKWLLMDIHQCSITTIKVYPDGEVKVLGVSDIGHIAPRLRTYI
jgi:serine/threonine-protein phosphatase PGAM5